MDENSVGFERKREACIEDEFRFSTADPFEDKFHCRQSSALLTLALFFFLLPFIRIFSSIWWRSAVNMHASTCKGFYLSPSRSLSLSRLHFFLLFLHGVCVDDIPPTHNLLFASARSCLRKRENSRRHFLSLPLFLCLIMPVLLFFVLPEKEEKNEDSMSQSMRSSRRRKKERRVWVVVLSEQEKARKSEGEKNEGIHRYTRGQRKKEKVMWYGDRHLDKLEKQSSREIDVSYSRTDRRKRWVNPIKRVMWSTWEACH